jgi:hypothetical protein
MGRLTSNDSTMFQQYFKEMAALIGIHVLYQYPIDMNFTMYAEEDPKGFSEEIGMDIIFDENPKVTTLRKYGWASKLEDDKPYMATLPFDAKNLCKGCRITIMPPQPLVGKNVFVITAIKANLEFPDSWACKLAPVNFSKQTKKLEEYKDKNNVFMNVED